MPTKQQLFDHLLALMQENGTAPEHLKLMQAGDWLERVLTESLSFLLRNYSVLKATRCWRVGEVESGARWEVIGK